MVIMGCWCLIVETFLMNLSQTARLSHCLFCSSAVLLAKRRNGCFRLRATVVGLGDFDWRQASPVDGLIPFRLDSIGESRRIRDSKTYDLADSVRASRTHTLSRTQARPDDSRLDGLQHARFNQPFLDLFLCNSNTAVQ